MKEFYKVKNNGIMINIYLQPASKEDKVVGLYEGNLKIKIKEKPIEGKANEYLIKFLSKLFKVPKSEISIISGETSKKKRIFLSLAEKKLIETLKLKGVVINE